MFIEENGKRLVIDPGDFTELPEDLSGITVVVITHLHEDHLGKENIKKILAVNPELILVGNEEVITALEDIEAAKETVTENGKKTIGGFELELFVGDHAVVYLQVPCQNLRLVVNGQLYYPGDSLVPLGRKVAAIATPLSAPWTKVSEILDFATASEADRFFPVHDMLLSDFGHGSHNAWLTKILAEKYQILEPGESLDI
jgi:hypothetical protein